MWKYISRRRCLYEYLDTSYSTVYILFLSFSSTLLSSAPLFCRKKNPSALHRHTSFSFFMYLLYNKRKRNIYTHNNNNILSEFIYKDKVFIREHDMYNIICVTMYCLSYILESSDNALRISFIQMASIFSYE